MSENVRITYCRLRVRLRAREAYEEPTFLGNTLRGVLGLSLRRVLCTTGLDSCDRCPVHTACWFEYLFESRRRATPDFALALDTAPHPFVMDVPSGPLILEAGDALDFALVLFGRAIDSVPYWMLALEELCRSGLGRRRAKFDLESIVGDDGRAIQDWESGAVSETHKKEWTYTSDGIAASSCTLEFSTPCRIKHDGRLSNRLEFDVLITNILRRASAISHFHCGRDPTIDFKALINRAGAIRIDRDELVWSEKPRFSSRQKARMSLGGVTGTIVYRGAMTEFVSLLRFGEIAHVGKATAFGMGQMRCSVLS